MKNKYSFSELLSNLWALLITKIFFRGARLIRRPIYIRGRNSLIFKNGLTLGHGCRFDLCGTEKTLFIGKNCQMGDMTHIVALDSVHIGDNVLMASKVFISDTNHGNYNGEIQDTPSVAPNSRKLVTKPVCIGSNVWIGENAVVLAGSEIGDGCIIGANALVKGKFPPNCIIGGIPAKILKKYDFETKRWEKYE